MSNRSAGSVPVKRAFSIIKVAKDLRDARQLSDAAARLAGQMIDVVSSDQNDPELRVCRVSLAKLSEWSGKKERQLRNLLRELERHKVFVRIETGRNIPINTTNTWLFDEVALASLADEARGVRQQGAKSTKPRLQATRQKITEVQQKMSESRQKIAPSSGLSSLGSIQKQQQQQDSSSVGAGEPEQKQTESSVIETIDDFVNVSPFAPKKNMEHNLSKDAVTVGLVAMKNAYSKAFKGKVLVTDGAAYKQACNVIRVVLVKALEADNAPSEVMARAMGELREDLWDLEERGSQRPHMARLSEMVGSYNITVKPRSLAPPMTPTPSEPLYRRTFAQMHEDVKARFEEILRENEVRFS